MIEKPIFRFFTFSTLLTFLTLSLVLNSCQNSGKPQTDLVTLDIISALKNGKEFRLSEMVDSIKYVKLETRPECLISSASKVIGEKYIVLLNSQPAQVLLFDRSGKFIRPIGKIGKGPGEYTYPIKIDLSPDEDRILVYDMALRQITEYSLDGIVQSAAKAPDGLAEGPLYLDSDHIAYMQLPWTDSLNYPRVTALNLRTLEQKSLWHIDYKRNPNQEPGYYIQNNFLATTDGIVFKDGLSDTIYHLKPDLSLSPVFSLKPFPNPPAYYQMSEEELDASSSVSLACYFGDFLLLIGTNQERFHVIYNSFTKETFRLPKIRECRAENDYFYGIINDLDGTDPVWFWGGTNVRSNQVSNLFQIVNLKEKIKTDCFLKADLRTDQYRDQLRKMVEESSENDNPIIRIMHLRLAR